MFSIDRGSHLLSDIFDQVLSCLVLINQNIDLLCDSVIILCAKIVNAGLDVIDILFSVVLVDVPAFQHSKETLVFLKTVFHDLQGLLPFLALIENAFVADSVSYDDYAAACSMLADNSKSHDKCWPKCSLAVAAVSELELKIVELELIEFCGVLWPISGSEFV